MTEEVYVEIMSKYLLPKAKSLYGDNWILHQDNDPKHTSSLAREFLRTSEIIWVILVMFFYYCKCGYLSNDSLIQI
jgi:hypothetical protein